MENLEFFKNLLTTNASVDKVEIKEDYVAIYLNYTSNLHYIDGLIDFYKDDIAKVDRSNICEWRVYFKCQEE